MVISAKIYSALPKDLKEQVMQGRLAIFMKKQNLFKLLFLVLFALVLLAGCGEKEDPVYEVSFDTDGGTACNPPDKLVKLGLLWPDINSKIVIKWQI